MLGSAVCCMTSEEIAVPAVTLGSAHRRVFAAVWSGVVVLHIDEQQRRVRRIDRDFAAQHDSRLQCSAQQTFEARCPDGLAGLVRDQVLTDFDLDMRQATAFGVLRDAIVGDIAHRVWGVIANHEVAFRAQQIEHDAGEAGIAVVQHADLHGA